ncbi:GEVED domain-containing protein [Kaistella rhinocerotis]|uniref:GEVED domain-containing protein n=1 Tax=Kaistella rhinocerotis TaxID=3026437 RepID=UPI00255676A9|nr:GEVED domain-containing protein [Kaistella sp. Ran72]
MKNFYSIIFFLGALLFHQDVSYGQCTTTDPNAYGSGSWIGHVYDHNGSGNPITTPFATYKGTTAETETFDRNYGTIKPACASAVDNFAIRYRMNKTFSAGNYTFTIGGDDGVRLSIDGGASWIVSDWSDHGYRTKSVRVPMSGNYNLVLEYYEKGGDAQVSFSYSAQTSINFSMPNANVNGVITTCSGTLYDSGGSTGSYSNSEDRVVIIKPAIAGNRVQISGSFNTEPGFDFITIYDGEGTTGTILLGGTVHGSGSTCTPYTVPVVTSTTGSLTVRFRSDTTNVCAGFSLAISCFSPLACSGPPVGGTTVLSSSTGTPSSTFSATVTGDTNATALSYQWQYASSTGGPWIDIAGATSASAVITAISSPGVSYYRRKITCSNQSSYSSIVTYTTQYCRPDMGAAQANNNYIKTVKFIGTMQDTEQNSTFSTNPAGYQDFTGNATKSIQAQGNGVNLYVENADLGRVRAWVDWNRDGNFDEVSEGVYTSNNTQIISTTFGFVIPAGTSPGNYVLRVRTSNASGSTTISPCGSINFAGETEDYSFTVVANCFATITSVSNQIRTGPGTVTFEATPSASSTKVRWYSSLTGGTPLAETNVVSGKSTWTSTVNNTTVYFVTAWNGNCESLVRTPVRAVVRPVPVITFSPAAPTSCGSNSTVKISASGQDETVYFVEEYFENGLGKFTQEILRPNTTTIDNKTKWQTRQSIFKPNEQVWFPAIASGTAGNSFAMATSDVGPDANNSSINNALISPTVNTLGYSSLTLSFRMYFSKYSNDGVADASDYVALEVNTGGSTWNEVIRYTKDVGFGTQFELKTIDMSSYQSSNLKFRFRYYAAWKDGVAIDDIEFFGVKPLTTTFAWTTSAPIDVYTDAAATIPYNNAPTTTVYMNPSMNQKETTANWTINATASLSNGTTATGSVIIENKNKVWNAATDKWNSNTWKPVGVVPTSADCVYIKTPVRIEPFTQAFAKEVYVENTGKLKIEGEGSLSIKDALVNKGIAENVVIESNASLIQVNEGNTINVGNITAKRKVNVSTGRQQYNYLISPLEGQSLKTVYPGIEYVLYHNEANNFFYNSTGAYIKGRALAVKEPKLSALPDQKATSVTATFTGYPTNGAFTYNLVNSNPSNINRGYNLVGNPYPSNMDLSQFYHINSASGNISNSFNLWDNRANSQTVQMGDKYEGQAYAVFHATTPPGEGTGTLATGDKDLAGTVRPTRYIKMGQGFMVKTRANNQTLLFNNTVRSDKDGPTFFGRAAGDSVNFDRFWLNMITPTNLRSDMAVVYFEGGTNGFSSDDAASLGGSDELYSRVDDRKVNINGRSIFTDEDVVPLGTRHFTTGEYRIELAGTDGIFSSAQPVYLKDKLTGAITNLSDSAYSFAAEAGESTGRFEIVYKPGGTLATDAGVKESVVVYRDKNDFHIRSDKRNITGLQLFDSSGRLVYSAKPNAAEFLIDANPLPNGVYFLKIERGFDVVSKKIIR